MKITTKGTVSSLAVGLIDLGAIEIDKSQGLVGAFQTATDITRTLLCVGGGIINYTGYEKKYTDTLFYASLPLFMKTVKNAVMPGLPVTVARARSAARAGFVPVSANGGVRVTPAMLGPPALEPGVVAPHRYAIHYNAGYAIE